MKLSLLCFLPVFVIPMACRQDHEKEARELWNSSNTIIPLQTSAEIGRRQFKDNIRQTDHLIAEVERRKDTLPEASYTRLKAELTTIRLTFVRLSEAYFYASEDSRIETIASEYQTLKYTIADENLDLERFRTELKTLEMQTAPIREKLIAITTENDIAFARLDSIREKLNAEWRTKA